MTDSLSGPGVVAAEGERSGQAGINWGLVVALGCCLGFWVLVVLGLVAFV